MREKFIKTPFFDEHLPFSIQHAGISYRDKTYRYFREKSDIMCIEYIVSGSGTVKTRDKVFYPKQGDTYILLPNERHDYFTNEEDPWYKIWINVAGSLPRSLIDVYKLQNCTLFPNCYSKPFIDSIHRTLKQSSLTSDQILAKCSIKFHELMQFLGEQKEKGQTVSSDAEKLKEYIDSHLYSNVTIEDLTGHIYKSPSQTIRIFKSQYNMTPYEYHLESRIKKAVSLLTSTNLPIKSIANELGFCDEHYFSALFKRKTGKKPTDYRKR